MVEERLAACANVTDGMSPIYWRDGKVMEAEEAAMVLKAIESLLPTLIQRLKMLNPKSGGSPVATSFGRGVLQS